ncbi:NAD(P)/FAD-dependent oxidoreductase [Ferribacterium limneticum]|uniref:NAD(P)/FAD-dependent oxidoreductase n=1 Tax=Ferribacterium limneticum TaxID=76259 RepID=UPI001CF97C97|nr:FAD-dependent oxidoreductase [Ferribacterium limneticum]UCV17772.1 FAD-dependent oxidoreductase [Ferribacterium limneticum]
MSSDFSDIVVLGAGIAGYTVAAELIRAGSQQRIVVIGEEPDAPYDRPPLSKEFLLNGDESALHFSELPQSQVEFWLGDPAVEVDTGQRVVRTANGRSLMWERIIFATGTVPRSVEPSSAAGRIHMLRTLADARWIRESVCRASSILLVGGGPIGLELAAYARNQDLKTTVIDAADVLMARSIPTVVGEHLYRFHTQRGVEVRLKSPIARIGESGTVYLVDGTEITADMTVVGIGVRANDELAHRAGIATEDGILVDEWFRTNVPSVFAVGDVARQRSAATGLYERNETWSSARDQAVALAKILMDPEGAAPFVGTPWFWSDQGGMYVQGAGSVRAELQTIRGDLAVESYSVLQWESGRLVGVASVNSPREFQLLRKVIGMQASLDPDEISDPGCNLKMRLKALLQ